MQEERMLGGRFSAASSFVQAMHGTITANSSLVQSQSGRDNMGALHVGFLWGSQANAIPATFWTLLHLITDENGAWDAVAAEVRENLCPSGEVSGDYQWTREDLS